MRACKVVAMGLLSVRVGLLGSGWLIFLVAGFRGAGLLILVIVVSVFFSLITFFRFLMDRMIDVLLRGLVGGAGAEFSSLGSEGFMGVLSDIAEFAAWLGEGDEEVADLGSRI